MKQIYYRLSDIAIALGYIVPADYCNEVMNEKNDEEIVAYHFIDDQGITIIGFDVYEGEEFDFSAWIPNYGDTIDAFSEFDWVFIKDIPKGYLEKEQVLDKSNAYDAIMTLTHAHKLDPETREMLETAAKIVASADIPKRNDYVTGLLEEVETMVDCEQIPDIPFDEKVAVAESLANNPELTNLVSQLVSEHVHK